MINIRSEVPGSSEHYHPEVTRMMDEGCPIDVPADGEQLGELVSLTPRLSRAPRGFRLSGPEAVDLSIFEDDGDPPPLEPAA